MAFVKARPNENIESLLKRFKRAVEKSGVLADLKKHEFYEKPSVKRKKKQAAARKRALKRDKKLAARKARAGTNQNFKWNKDKTQKIPLKPRPQNNNYQSRDSRGPSSNSKPNNRPYNKTGNKPSGGYKGKKFNNNFKKKPYNPKPQQQGKEK